MKKILLSISMVALAMSANAKVYFEDDFEWFAPWSEATGVHDWVNESETVKAESKNLGSVAEEGGQTLYDALLAKGYTFVQAKHPATKYEDRDHKAVMYVQKHYLKMGLTGYHAGIVLPALKDVPANEELTVSFDWAPMRQGDPGAENRKYDPSELVVIVANGETEEQVAVPAHTLQAGDAMKWMHADVSLKGKTVNENTKITIRQIDSQFPYLKDEKASKVCRYFIDNIKVASAEGGSAVAEVEVAEDAPVEYYNLQGVRVANPENGLFIVKQGNKVSKKIFK